MVFPQFPPNDREWSHNGVTASVEITLFRTFVFMLCEAFVILGDSPKHACRPWVADRERVRVSSMAGCNGTFLGASLGERFGERPSPVEDAGSDA